MYTTEVNDKLAKLKQNFEKCFDHLKGELASLRAGRANAALLDKVFVDYYGTPTQLKQMANIMATDARTLTVSLWDISAVKEASRAIGAANLGLMPSDDGKIIRLTLPAMTEDRRKEFVKQVRQMGENSKISIRNERRDVLDFCKKQKNEKLLTEDDIAAIEKDVQKQTDAAVTQVDAAVTEKEKEIMTV